jgi:hypothetical protein
MAAASSWCSMEARLEQEGSGLNMAMSCGGRRKGSGLILLGREADRHPVMWIFNVLVLVAKGETGCLGDEEEVVRCLSVFFVQKGEGRRAPAVARFMLGEYDWEREVGLRWAEWTAWAEQCCRKMEVLGRIGIRNR